jgi:TIMELESS-interacting protein
LDSVRLNSDRGLLALEREMRNVKLRGRGNELADYDIVMGKLQHWAHRLFPSYTFDDCLDKLEKLGTKKVVNVSMHTYKYFKLILNIFCTLSLRRH